MRFCLPVASCNGLLITSSAIRQRSLEDEHSKLWILGAKFVRSGNLSLVVVGPSQLVLQEARTGYERAIDIAHAYEAPHVTMTCIVYCMLVSSWPVSASRHNAAVRMVDRCLASSQQDSAPFARPNDSMRTHIEYVCWITPCSLDAVR